MNEELTKNPTVVYLVEEIKKSVEMGAPILNESINQLLTQVSNFGVASLIVHLSAMLLFGLVNLPLWWLAKKAITSDRNWTESTILITGISGIYFITYLVTTIANINLILEDVMMITAPALWIIQNAM